jgi:hypothetical protein
MEKGIHKNQKKSIDENIPSTYNGKTKGLFIFIKHFDK